MGGQDRYIEERGKSDNDNSNLQGKSKKVRVIGGSKQIAGSKGKTNFYWAVNI